jgi:hypothetical protein
MKKYALLLLTLVVFCGCSPDDNNPNFHLELLPVESATFPAEFVRDSIYEIPIRYNRPTSCYVYEGLYYYRELNKRTIAIQTSVLEQDNCTTAVQNPVEEILKFKPTTEDSYIFKLWKGKDASGVNIYQEITIPVVP